MEKLVEDLHHSHLSRVLPEMRALVGLHEGQRPEQSRDRGPDGSPADQTRRYDHLLYAYDRDLRRSGIHMGQVGLLILEKSARWGVKWLG